MSKRLLCLLLLIGITTPLSATDKGWTEVRSPHFRVLTNHSEKEGRDVALGMEQIRAIFAESLPGLRVDSDVETVVFAARDYQTMRQLLDWGKNTEYIAGAYKKGSEVDYALLRLDLWQPQSVVYHEYVHKLLHLNFTRLPRWLDEGLAEFFANSGMRDGKTTLGMGSPRLESLKYFGVDPVEKMITFDYATQRTWEAKKIEMFYAESWALTHYLMLKDGVQSVDKVNQYLKAIQQGGNPTQTFTKIWGDPKEITKALTSYVNQRTWPALVIANPAKIDSSQFTASKLPGAQMSAEMAGLFLRVRRYSEARDKLQDALKEDPNNWLAHENLGFVNYGEGKIQEAFKEWDAALALNPKAVLSLYYRNLVELRPKKDPDSVAKLKDAIDKVLAIDPEMTVAHVQRARLFAMQGDTESALAAAKRVLKLEPDLAGYFLNYAEMELLRKNYSTAIRTSRWVASRWYGSDRAEALELADRARRMGGITATEQEKTEEATWMEYAKGTTELRGTIESVTCDKSGRTLVVRSGEKKFTFRGGSVGHGGSDTLGITGEHFDPCYHATGLRVVVRAKAAPSESGVVDMTTFELRNDLLPGEIE